VAIGSSRRPSSAATHGAARDVVQAGAVSKEARQDVEVDHIDQAAFEQRRADRGREDRSDGGGSLTSAFLGWLQPPREALRGGQRPESASLLLVTDGRRKIRDVPDLPPALLAPLRRDPIRRHPECHSTTGPAEALQR
jgi:hypothetical protein